MGAAGTKGMPRSERETQILDIASEHISQHGYAGLSTDAVAAAAGVSKPMVYHYFGGKQGFFEAVVQYAADDLYVRTAPAAEGDALERLLVSIAGYVDYVVANQTGYRSLVRAAAGGNDAVRAIYETTFAALADRFFTSDTGDFDLPDTPAVRLVIRAWQAMTEDLVLAWCEDPAGLSREDLLQVITSSLPAVRPES